MAKFVSIFLCLFSIGLFAQEHGAIKGIVLDTEMANEPLMFANIELKGSSLAAQSNLFGKFEIAEIEPGNYTLVISQAGYQTVEIPVEIKINEITTIQQALGAETISLEELAFIRTEDKKEVDDFTSSLTIGEKD